MRFSIFTLLTITFLAAVYLAYDSLLPRAAPLFNPAVVAALAAGIYFWRRQSVEWEWSTIAGTTAAFAAALVWHIKMAIGLASQSWPLDPGIAEFAIFFIALQTMSGFIAALIVSVTFLSIRRRTNTADVTVVVVAQISPVTTSSSDSLPPETTA